jgi:hypothetical protein
MKRIVLIALAALMSFALLSALTGCGKSDEQAIREGLTQELEDLRNPDSDLRKEIINEAAADLETVGIDPQKFFSALLDGFKFEIGTITVSGNKATAEITMTCRQAAAAMQAATERGIAEVTADMTEEQIQARIGEIILEELGKASLETTTVTIPCTKTDNVWSEDAGAEDIYMNTLFGG